MRNGEIVEAGATDALRGAQARLHARVDRRDPAARDRCDCWAFGSSECGMSPPHRSLPAAKPSGDPPLPPYSRGGEVRRGSRG